jgi:pimeloyl-ACP methyl ester carboxylesterase
MNKQLKIPWKGKELAATAHFPTSYYETIEKTSLYPIIIICHGFIGSRIGVNRLFVKTSEEISSHEAIVVRFDYVGCGESEGTYGENDLEGLIDQTKSVIDFSLKMEKVNTEKLLLIGHSLGGAVALLTAVVDQRVKKLILWSAVANPYRDILNIVGEEYIRKFQESPVMDYLGYSFSKKFFQSLAKYQPLQELARFNGDVLVVHGTDDEEIKVDYCFHYYYAFRSRLEGTCEKQVILGANHTYSSLEGFRQLIKATKEWLFDKKVLIL